MNEQGTNNGVQYKPPNSYQSHLHQQKFEPSLLKSEFLWCIRGNLQIHQCKQRPLFLLQTSVW